LRINANVVLAQQRLQLPMAMAMEVERPAVLAIPAAKRIVTKDQQVLVDRELDIVLNARLPGRL
jgi:hypothetical protein